MGYLDELHSDLKTVQQAIATAGNKAEKLQRKSIARGALDGTAQFPALIDDSIAIDMASTIARVMDPVYASFLQTYLSLNSTIDITVDQTPLQFLKKFHQNVKVLESLEVSDSERDEYLGRIYDGSYKVYMNESKTVAFVFNVADGPTRAMLESHKEQLEDCLSYIDVHPFPQIGNSKFFENTDLNPRTKEFFMEAEDAPNASDAFNTFLKDKQDEADKKAEADRKATWEKYNSNKKPGEAGGARVLKDQDVKKTNDMQPYSMQVRLIGINDKKEFVQFIDFIIGVKVILHPIKSEEMIVNIKHAIDNNGKFFNFIKWTTGEKSLIKDLLLHINEIKLDVANQSQGASKWWNTLKRLKNESKEVSSFFTRHGLVPNSTMVVSSYTVDAIQAQYGYNLRDPKMATKLMESLFLMTFMIVDSGTQIIQILYDKEPDFQTYAYEALEREVQASSSKLGKELTRMISR